MYDKDHDGILSVQKLGAVLRALGHNPTEIEIQEMIDEIDSEGCMSFELLNRLSTCDKICNGYHI
jgi:calmodulin